MGIHSISISFAGATAGYATYSPGDSIRGIMTLVISGSEPHKLSSVLVKVRGLAKTMWKTRSGSGKNRRTHTHTEEIWLIREDIFFIRGPTVEALHPGTYQYEFSHTLRRGLPPTYSCQYGTISYLCKARAISHDLFAFNGKSEYNFTVLPLLDLNTEASRLGEPLTVQREAETSWFGHAIGQYTLTMSHQACVGGQRIHFTISGPDRLFEKMLTSYGVVKLKRGTLCTAGGSTREEKQDVVVEEPGRSSTGWREFELVVPRHAGMTISAAMCRIITVTYYVKIKSRHINVSLPLVVGTVPLAAAARHWQPVPSAPQLQPGPSPHSGGSPAGTWGRSPHSGGSPAGTWGRSPRPSPRHSPAPQSHSPSAPALAAATPAPSYEPPPSYEQVMQGLPVTPSAEKPGGEHPAAQPPGGDTGETKQEEEDTKYTHLGNL